MIVGACGRRLMKASLSALLGLCVLVDASALRAEESTRRTWRLEAEEPRLDYGTGGDDIEIALSCKAGAGVVEVMIGETGKGVKAGRSMTASLTAGRSTSKLRGKTEPN